MMKYDVIEPDKKHLFTRMYGAQRHILGQDIIQEAPFQKGRYMPGDTSKLKGFNPSYKDFVKREKERIRKEKEEL